MNSISPVSFAYFAQLYPVAGPLQSNAPVSVVLASSAQKPKVQCCDGYSIEAVLDEAYENNLGNNSQIKRLEKYPCISCDELESIADELSISAFANETDSATKAKRLKDLNDVSNAIDLFGY